MELKELHGQMQEAFAGFKAATDRMENEIKTFGEATGETKGLVERLNARLDEVETKMNRKPVDGDHGGAGEKGASTPKEVKAAFEKFARKGRDSMSPDEIKLLSVGDDTTGGYLAPTELANEIDKGVIEFSPIRPEARIRTTSAKSVAVPKRVGTFAATWVGETETRGESTGLKYGLEDIPVREMTATVLITFADLEDSAFDLAAEIEAEFAEQFGVAEGLAFVKGQGNKQPEGLLTNPDVTFITTAGAGVIDIVDLIDLMYGVKTSYGKNGKFILNRTSLAKIRKMKDSNGQLIWQPSAQAGQPATILGAGYVEAPDMPDVATGAFPVAFGDLKRAYTIADRLGLAITRDANTLADQGVVRFIGRKRLGAQVTRAEALKKLKIQ